MSTKRRCAVCGYESDDPNVIHVYPDRIKRCKVCVSKLAHGRFIPRWEEMRASEEQISQWKQEYDEWYADLSEEMT